MAEFFNVMVEMRRMHDDYDDCNDGCPLCNKGFCDKPWCEVSEEDIKEAEKIIMKWSKEHSVVYPTWGEWFAEQGELSVNWKDLRVVSCSGKSSAGVIGLFYSEIPADIAQKLGIEPKEG